MPFPGNGHQWVHNGLMLDAEFPAGPVYSWLAGEASVVTALRRRLAGERGQRHDRLRRLLAGRRDAGGNPEVNSSHPFLDM
ncbi:MAG TPA: SIP domain-containing protein [Pseudonocardiaceae bacterium]|jgi:hypothetical protein|nr:SIP domain-containing protein [Pseudonocardiaceae bacterium]